MMTQQNGAGAAAQSADESLYAGEMADIEEDMGPEAAPELRSSLMARWGFAHKSGKKPPVDDKSRKIYMYHRTFT